MSTVALTGPPIGCLRSRGASMPAPDATRSTLRPDEPDQQDGFRGPQSMARRASVVQTPRPSTRWPSALMARRAGGFSTRRVWAAHTASASTMPNMPPVYSRGVAPAFPPTLAYSQEVAPRILAWPTGFENHDLETMLSSPLST